jgi:hypothetical protein
MAIKANLVIDQGTDFEATIDVTDNEDNVFDLTDYTATAQMRKNYAASAATTFTCTTNGIDGQINLSLVNSITADLTPGRYLYDVEITSISSGKVIRVVEGIVTVTPGMTRI